MRGSKRSWRFDLVDAAGEIVASRTWSAGTAAAAARRARKSLESAPLGVAGGILRGEGDDRLELPAPQDRGRIGVEFELPAVGRRPSLPAADRERQARAEAAEAAAQACRSAGWAVGAVVCDAQREATGHWAVRAEDSAADLLISGDGRAVRWIRERAEGRAVERTRAAIDLTGPAKAGRLPRRPRPPADGGETSNRPAAESQSPGGLRGPRSEIPTRYRRRR